MNILITGRAGRIGSAVYRLFKSHHLSIIGLDQIASPTTDCLVDLLEIKAHNNLLKEIDVIIHCAALHAPHVGHFSDQQFYDLDITEFEAIGQTSNAYVVYTTKARAAALEAMSQVKNVDVYYNNQSSDFENSEYTFYPYNKKFKWNQDNYGPIIIPSKGMTIKLNLENYLLYERCITVYEGNTLKVKEGNAILNGEVATEYTFKMDYYWMMGDNRHRSQDSRFWGFVPEDHIVGKAWFLVTSFSKEKGFLRLDRTFKGIHSNWAPKEEKYTQ